MNVNDNAVQKITKLAFGKHVLHVLKIVTQLPYLFLCTQMWVKWPEATFLQKKFKR